MVEVIVKDKPVMILEMSLEDATQLAQFIKKHDNGDFESLVQVVFEAIHLYNANTSKNWKL